MKITKSEAQALAANAVYPAFRGRGWSFPPTFDRQAAAVIMASADTDIMQSLWIILSTSLGERIMVPGFGCDLISKLFASLSTTTANEIALMVTRSITEWEPRVTLDNVTVTNSTGDTGWIEINIEYTIRETNARSNLVFPYYLLEASLPSPPA